MGPGGPDALSVEEVETPAPRPGRARVRVLASGVAYGDALKREGRMPAMPRMPYTPGYDLVGEVEAVCPGSRWTIGDRVAALVMNGANADHVLVEESDLVRLPSGVDPVRALCVCLNYVTAWQMLTRVASARRGERLLVHGAGGGAGTAALDLARELRLETHGTASPGKHAVVRSFGAEPIDYRARDFVAVARGWPGGGADIVLDGVGGAHLRRSWAALRAGGRLVGYGIAAANQGERGAAARTLALLLARLWRPDGRRARFYTILPNGVARFFPGVWSGRRAQVNADLALMLQKLAAGRLTPVVGAVLPLARAAEAHALLDRAAAGGKIVLVP